MKCWFLQIAAGDEGIKRRRHVRKEGKSDQANQKAWNSENISYQLLLRLWTDTDDVQRSYKVLLLIQYVNINGCDLFFYASSVQIRRVHIGPDPLSQHDLPCQMSSAIGQPTTNVRTSPTSQIDPLPISPRSRNLCKANNIADSRLKNEFVSTGASLLWIVVDHIPSLYLDGAALCYSLRPYRSIWGSSRNYTRRHPKTGLCVEVVCRR